MTGMGMFSADTVTMAASGLLVAVVVPALMVWTPAWAGWRVLSVRAVVALPLFVLVHGATVLLEPSGTVRLAVEMLLLYTATLYWLPVLGTRHRLSDAGRSVYLYLSMPLLDLPAVVMVAKGHTAGGLAMVVTMLPIGLAALGITWRWITREERLAQAAE